jgi:hypothetical protein
MEGKVDVSAPSTLAFALACRASKTRRTGMAEDSDIVFYLETWMQNAPPWFRSQK